MAIDESYIIRLKAEVDGYIKDVQKAGKVTTTTQKGIETSFNKVTQAMQKTNKGFQGLGRNAGQAGIQVQQFVGQIQGGQSAMLALSQQSADLGIVLGAPLVGVIAGLSASLIGILIPALGQTKTELELLEEQFDKFKKDLEETDELSKDTFKQIEIGKLETEARLLTQAIDSAKQSLMDLQNAPQTQSVTSQIFGTISQLDEYDQKLTKLRERQAALFDAALEGFEFSEVTPNTSPIIPPEEFEAQSQIFFEKFGLFNELVLEQKAAADQAEIDLNQMKVDKLIAQDKKAADTRVRQEKQAALAREIIQLSSLRSIVGGLSALNSAFLDDNKAFNAGLIVADTAAAAMAAYKAGASTGIPGAGAAAAFKAITTGAAQLAANNSASKGGGTISGGGSGGFITPNSGDSEQIADTSTTVSVEDISTQQTQVVRIELDGLDTFIEGVSSKIDEGKANGSL